MNFFENNLRKMFENSEVIDNPYFCGNCMIGRLDEDVRIKVRFTTEGVSDSYPALAVIDGEYDVKILLRGTYSHFINPEYAVA